MRTIGISLVLISMAASLCVLSVSLMNFFFSFVLLLENGFRESSTCAMTKAMGARLPLCSVRTGLRSVDLNADWLLQDISALRLWICLLAAAAVTLVATMKLLARLR